MTPAEADQRIILSRHTLARYVQMTKELRWPIDDLPLFQSEIAMLEAIAEEHPGKVAKLVKLVSEWVAFREAVRSKMN